MRAILKSLALLSATALVVAANAIDPQTERASVEQWRTERVAELTGDTGFLTLTGLFWLKPGANTFGSNPDNAIVFPKGPGHAGAFDLNGSEVTLKLLPDSHATIDGQAATSVRLDPDTSKQVTRVEMGTLGFGKWTW